uniref:Uncharacterized protein n=1 Tax=Arundo donax TaxID=35708 RepID=A0A0A9AF35_ARUDO
MYRFKKPSKNKNFGGHPTVGEKVRSTTQHEVNRVVGIKNLMLVLRCCLVGLCKRKR